MHELPLRDLTLKEVSKVCGAKSDMQKYYEIKRALEDIQRLTQRRVPYSGWPF